INMDQRKKDLLKEIETFEAVFPDGVYAVPPKQGQPRIKVREMFKYCRQNGKESEELTEKGNNSMIMRSSRETCRFLYFKKT
ncbi:hypothetical protein, partial [Fictibacillus sp. NRS-1165]|uniref:hypothetical protein n=1 Tax=Fictibacillus sp. NRS-1165 TaxID=3144463 RepID=UPI003D2535CF